MLGQEFPHEGGGVLQVSAACIDSGFNTHSVYAFTREHRGKFWLATKGQSQRGKPAIGKPSRVDLNLRGQILKGGAEVYPVGSDTIKTVIYSRLKFNEPGPGYYHFHAGLEDDYFEQLTAEKQVTRYQRGFAHREWVKKPGARNEALDCEVYAYAALQFLYSRFNRDQIWKIMAKKLEMSKGHQGKPQQITNNPQRATPTPKPTIAPRRPNWVNKW